MDTDNVIQNTQVERLLRCRRTERYFNNGGWTPDPSLAKTFPNQLDAIRECLQHRLADVDLVLRTAGGGAEFFTTELC